VSRKHYTRIYGIRQLIYYFERLGLPGVPVF